MPSTEANGCRFHSNKRAYFHHIQFLKSTMAAQMLASASTALMASAQQCKLHSTGKPARALLAGHALSFSHGKGLRTSKCCPRVERNSSAMRCQAEYRVLGSMLKHISCSVPAAANFCHAVIQTMASGLRATVAMHVPWRRSAANYHAP